MRVGVGRRDGVSVGVERHAGRCREEVKVGVVRAEGVKVSVGKR